TTTAPPEPPASNVPMEKLAPGEQAPQFVLFSFDGAGSHDHWRRVLPLAKKVNAHVTGFLSGIYLLPDQLRGTYTGPGHGAGRASISFGGTEAEVATRIADLNTAYERGHEIGTHYNGHFCAGNEPSGGAWSRDDWTSELDQFFTIMRGAAARGLRVPPDTIKGGRAPCLEGKPDAFLPAMSKRKMIYDTSVTAEGVAWPTQRDGIWEFWVPVVRVPALSGKRVIMMDYNLWYSLNGAKEEPARDGEFTAITLDTYRAAYQAAFNTNRAPLTVGNHFNDWSGGAFSRATEQFMNEVCVRDQTVCATYSEVIEWMKLQDPAILDTYRNKPHAQVS
ncbi:MAG: polysaccharide deacetylase, partial [Stackebrandtia sp.]